MYGWAAVGVSSYSVADYYEYGPAGAGDIVSDASAE